MSGGPPSLPDLAGHVALVTGATSGIGRVLARRLAESGATVAVAGRDEERCRETVEELRRIAPAAPTRAFVADLAERSGVVALADQVRAAYPGLDILINNAGAVYADRAETSDGVERTFALNVEAPFLLTQLLLGRLRTRAPSRVVMVASEAHRWGRLRWDDLDGRRSYGGMRAYNASKLALVLLTREMAARLAGTGVVVNAAHPGFVRTRWGLNNRGWFGGGVRVAAALFGTRPERGARTPLRLATDPALAAVTGGYFVRGRPRTPSAAACSVDDGRRLWAELERRAGDALPAAG